MTPVSGIDGHASRQAGGLVGQRVEVGVGRVGIEADAVALGVGLVGDVGAEDRCLVGRWLTVQVKLSVSVSVPSLTVTMTLCVPALAELSVPLMTPVAALIDRPRAGRWRE